MLPEKFGLSITFVQVAPIFPPLFRSCRYLFQPSFHSAAIILSLSFPTPSSLHIQRFLNSKYSYVLDDFINAISSTTKHLSTIIAGWGIIITHLRQVNLTAPLGLYLKTVCNELILSYSFSTHEFILTHFSLKLDPNRNQSLG